MKSLKLNRSFLKKSWSGILILFLIVLFYEILSWSFNPEYKATKLENYDGFWGYIYNWAIGFYLPELVSLFIVIVLIDRFHDVLKIDEISLKTSSVLLYEAKLIPVFLTAYFFFIPITLHLRFFIREFPKFDAQRYEDIYLGMLYTPEGYMTYTPFVFILGYLLLNISLIVDFLQNLKKSASSTDTIFDAFASFATGTRREYLQLIDAKTNSGDTILNVNECYLFETVDNEYFVEHNKGRFKITKSLTELENELDPDRFFRGNRGYIMNLDHFDSYSYWEKGKYILRCNKLPHKDLVMPRARMQNLKKSLENNVVGTTDEVVPLKSISNQPKNS